MEFGFRLCLGQAWLSWELMFERAWGIGVELSVEKYKSEKSQEHDKIKVITVWEDWQLFKALDFKAENVYTYLIAFIFHIEHGQLFRKKKI